jgi:hypothetical protein
MRKLHTKTNFIFIFFALITLFALLFFPPRIDRCFAQFEEGNLKVHVTCINTFINGTYATSNAYGAKVIVTEEEYNLSRFGYANVNGWVEFTLNITGFYTINITYMDAFYEVHRFYADIRYEAVTYLYEGVFRLVSFHGDQFTRFLKLKAEMPATVTFTFPKSTDINFTVESYGLKVRVEKGETYHSVTPLDVCAPQFDPKTLTYFTPNYTVTLRFKTVERGQIGFYLVDNGTMRVAMNPFYLISEQATVTITYVLDAFQERMATTLNEMKQKLDFIIQLLLENRELHNKTIVPMLFGMYGHMDTLFKNAFSGVDFAQLARKIGDTYTEVQRVYDTDIYFNREFKGVLREVFDEYLSDIRAQTYIVGFVVVVVVIAATASYYKSKKTSQGERKSDSVIIKSS